MFLCFRRCRIYHAASKIKDRPAKPPTTPPTMAPTFVPDPPPPSESGVSVDVFAGVSVGDVEVGPGAADGAVG